MKTWMTWKSGDFESWLRFQFDSKQGIELLTAENRTLRKFECAQKNQDRASY